MCLSAASCAVCCICGHCCKCGGGSDASAKFLYILLFFISSIVGICLRYWGDELFVDFYAFEFGCDSDRCFGIQAVYRVSFGLFAFFAVTTILTGIRRQLHTGAWLLKLIALVTLIVVSFFIPNEFFIGYAEFARVGSFFFLLLQMLLLIEFAYAVHEGIVARMEKVEHEHKELGHEEGLCSNKWKLLYLVLVVALFVGIVGVIVWLYIDFGDCPLNQFFISETMIMGVIYTMMSMYHKINKGLITPFIVWANSLFLCWGILTNNPDEACGVVDDENSARVVIGLGVVALSLSWTAFRAASGSQKTFGDEQAGGRGDVVELGNAKSRGRDNDSDDDEDKPKAAPRPIGAEEYERSRTKASPDAGSVPRRVWLFHLVMALAGLYMAMLLSSWGTADNSAGDPQANPERSNISVWVRFASQVTIYILFIWTLIAPLCCSDRDFGGASAPTLSAQQ